MTDNPPGESPSPPASNSPREYRMKPVTVMAMRWTGDPQDRETMMKFIGASTCHFEHEGKLKVFANNVWADFSPGQWIVSDAADTGRFWAVNHEAFLALYEPIDQVLAAVNALLTKAFNQDI